MVGSALRVLKTSESERSIWNKFDVLHKKSRIQVKKTLDPAVRIKLDTSPYTGAELCVDQDSRSKTAAAPIPPPMHMLTTP